MSIIGFINRYRRQFLAARLQRRLLRQAAPESLDPGTWERSLRDPTAFYLDCFRYFHQCMPAEWRAHRDYFSKQRRGFGEDAFHVMWKLLLDEFKPGNFLEIGVFRGQVISLVGLWSRQRRVPCEVWGISPFSGSGDSTSSYRRDFDYYQDVLQNFDHFGLPHANLLHASSTDREALDLIASRSWDMIYIDGNHDYDMVLKDWEACSKNIKPGGIIVLDDSGLTTSYRSPVFSTAGIEGPSRVAKGIDRTRFREWLQVGHNRSFRKLR